MGILLLGVFAFFTAFLYDSDAYSSEEAINVAAEASAGGASAESADKVDAAVVASLEALPELLAEPVEAERCSMDHVSSTDIKIKRNDTFYTIMLSLGVPVTEILEMVRSADGVYDLKSFKEGDVLKVTSVAGDVERIDFKYSDIGGVFVERGELKGGKRGFVSASYELPHSVEEVFVKGVISSSFYEAGVEAGADPSVIMNLSDIFAWDVDFATDIRKGDGFSVIYDALYVEGVPMQAERIHAAEMYNNGKRHIAIYFKGADGRGEYYDEEGRTLRRALLKSPLRYSRISSYFSKKRYHPILKKYKAHHGIDYAAPKGTPVESAGDGRVVFAGWKGGYGKYIIVRHNSTYSTAYGHLSRIKKGVRKGSRVEQGKVIGYVGSTGLSTGPHLHYEVRLNNKVVNPLAIKSTPRKALGSDDMKAFVVIRDEVLRKLDTSDAPQDIPNADDEVPLKVASR
jgi:murein DD-endopeptidase MepM/ murein hydrolase activator NlpD